MRTLIIIALCMASIASTAQEYPIYSPVRIYGSLTMDPVAVLPTGTPLKMVNSAGKLWIYDGAWKQLWPPKFNSDTLDNLFIKSNGIIKFVEGGFMLIHAGPASIGISPNGDTDVNRRFFIARNSEPTGVTIGGMQSLLFTSLLYANQDFMRGFTNDTTSDADTVFAASLYAVKRIASARGGISPGTVGANQAVYGTAVDKIGGSNNIQITEDSIRILNQITGEFELIGFTPSGALKIFKPIASFGFILTDTLAVTPDSTQHLLCVYSALSGYNLIAVELKASESTGNRVPTVTVWRNRSGTEVNMTSTGATLTTDAVINTSYDDVIKGDAIRFKTVLGSGEIPPYGLNVQLTFQKQ